MADKNYTDEDLEKYTEPKGWEYIRQALAPPTQKDMDRLSSEAGTYISNNIDSPVKIVPDTGEGILVPSIPVSRGGTSRIPVKFDWSLGNREPKNTNLAGNSLSNIPSSEEQKRLTHRMMVSEGNLPQVTTKQPLVESQGGLAGQPGTDIGEVGGGLDISAFQRGHTFTNKDMQNLYPEGVNMPYAYASNSLPNGSFVARTDNPNATIVPAGGVDTGNIDLEEILSKYMGAANQQGTNAGLALPTGKGWLSAVMGLSQIINSRKEAERSEARRWHRGVEMTKLVSDVMDRNKKYGLDTRRLGMEEQEHGYKQPYFEAQTKEAGSRAGLYDAQAKNQLSLQEQKEMAVHQHIISEANKAANAAVTNPMNEKSWDEVYNETYNAMMNSFNNSKKGGAGTTDRVALNQQKYNSFVGQMQDWAKQNKKTITNQDIYTGLKQQGWKDEEIQAAGGQTFGGNPKEGDTKTLSSGNKAIFKNGKWVKV